MNIEDYESRISQIHEDIIQLKKDMEADNSASKETYAHIANETIDLHHLIELMPTQAHESARIVSRFRDLRGQRREAKNKMSFFNEVLPSFVKATNAIEQVVVDLSLYRRNIIEPFYRFRTQEGKDFADSFKNVEDRMSGYLDTLHDFPGKYESDHEDTTLSKEQAAPTVVDLPRQPKPEDYVILHRDEDKNTWVSIFVIDGKSTIKANTNLKTLYSDPHMDLVSHARFQNISNAKMIYHHSQNTLQSLNASQAKRRRAEMTILSYEKYPFVTEEEYDSYF